MAFAGRQCKLPVVELIKRLPVPTALVAVVVVLLADGLVFIPLDHICDTQPFMTQPFFICHASATNMNPPPIGTITDAYSLELDGASGVATFAYRNTTYATIVTIFDDGVQIIDPLSTNSGKIW